MIEIDYPESDGRSSLSRYAKMAAAGRLSQLVGYEVYRFGTYELCQPNLLGFTG
ncbi:hypothetical protein PSCICM_40170 [Pseudomonas cichorii]|nr:hypothetical protein PSCICM_40170 [Pseudomonas cichorii]